MAKFMKRFLYIIEFRSILGGGGGAIINEKKFEINISAKM
jgi:hypothetical protein